MSSLLRFLLTAAPAFLFVLAPVVVASAPARAFADDDDSAAGDDDSAAGDDDSAAGDDDDDTVVDDDDSAGDDDDTVEEDLDGDGYSGDADCDDNNPLVYDDDLDGDGFSPCGEPADCDDSSADASPDIEQVEVCGDALDNDCDGGVDNIDLDSDGFVGPDCGGDDCDDENATINPGAGESGGSCADEIDNDCDGALEGGGIDETDPDCFEEPEVDAGGDSQERYVGGTILVVFDGSGTRDPNADDTLSYTWVLDTALDAYSGVTAAFVTDPASPYAYLRFHAAPDAPDTSWAFDAHLVVSDGVFTSDAAAPEAQASALISRVTRYQPVACGLAAPEPSSGSGAGPALLAAAGLVARRRRRIIL
jgi:hypothetical protein